MSLGIEFDYHKETVAALDRLAYLEEVVSWHSFDELPIRGSLIECKSVNGEVCRINWHIYSCDDLMFKSVTKSFAGWRYPVGDLS